MEELNYATESDYRECAALHRLHGTTYYFASRRLPEPVRRQIDAVYGFVRVPDEWVDNPGDCPPEAVQERLTEYRSQYISALYGVRPTYGVLRAFVDVMRATDIPVDEPLMFLDAMEMDLEVRRYPTYDDLRRYMRGSAAAVGIMLCHVLGAPRDAKTTEAAMALGEAMQLTNFIRDVGEDRARGRIYLPLEDLERFGLTEEDIIRGKFDPRFVPLMQFQIERARQRYADSDAGIERIPREARFGVALARDLYARILTKVEENGCDVFSHRARTTPQEKIMAAWRLWSKGA